MDPIKVISMIRQNNSAAGKITISVAAIFALIFSSVLYSYSYLLVNDVIADTADTSVTVLNTPPGWDVQPNEAPASSGTSPTNSGDSVTWTATATDSNGQDYYLLICKTSAAPTANNNGTAPDCDAPSNQWAVSAATTSGSQATATYTTSEADSAQSNAWYAWICDSPTSDAACNATSYQGDGAGDGTDDDSPFIINFRPTFTAFADDSPADPGTSVTWTSTAADSAKNTSFSYNLTLHVCKANDFTGTACGAGGTWCTSSAVASDPTCNATMDDPMTDGTHEAYGYVIDAQDHTASGGSQGSDSVIDINNVAPSVGAASVSLLDTDEAGSLTLTTANGQTTGFKVKFSVTDQNSCENQVGGDEISSAIINVYRSGITQAGCDTAGESNTNNCYPDADTNWNPTCTQDAGTCSGTTDNSVDWTCTFPLWFNADATEGAAGDSQFPTENWVASVQATDDDASTSTLTEGTTGNEMLKFMAYSVPENAISYGSLEAGQNTGATNQTTTIEAVGNTGVDEDLSGTEMCTTFNPGSPPNYGCNQNTSDTIFSTSQKYDTATFDYTVGGNALPESPADAVAINVPKTTNEASPASGLTYWGIEVPSTITLAGSYSGQNSIVGTESAVANW
ncbi:MAG: hypothetical protein R3346_01625 [Candidatus Spechtbacterales bacterium]|nr:hypothetical protein [Candidatus Spechtbacterales bacterium]